MKNLYISHDDLRFINDLSQRTYFGNSLSSNASDPERNRLTGIKERLKDMADFFSERYAGFGPFEIEVSPRSNPISMGGTRLHRVWSCFYKGGDTKQGAAQISFVINPDKPFVDVGFYFGMASWRSVNTETRQGYEKTLKKLGRNLSMSLQQNAEMKTKFLDLLESGFMAYSNGEEVSGERWIQEIGINAKNSKVIMRLYANDLGILEMSTIDTCISNVIFLMNGILGTRNNKSVPSALTPEQRAKKAEMLARIGFDGEKFILDEEIKRLKERGQYIKDVYPRHVALDSDSFGFDIKSLDEDREEIYIEVKSTTAKKTDNISHNFFLSINEYKTYQENKKKYRLYRVYDIYNSPSYDIINLDKVTIAPDGYVVKY